MHNDYLRINKLIKNLFFIAGFVLPFIYYPDLYNAYLLPKTLLLSALTILFVFYISNQRIGLSFNTLVLISVFTVNIIISLLKYNYSFFLMSYNSIYIYLLSIILFIVLSNSGSINKTIFLFGFIAAGLILSVLSLIEISGIFQFIGEPSNKGLLTIGNKNFISVYYAIIMILLWYLKFPKNIKFRILFCILLIINILYFKSTAVIFSLIISFFIINILKIGKYKYIVLTILTVLLLIILFIYLNYYNGWYSYRFLANITGLKIFADNYISGVGIGLFERSFPYYKLNALNQLQGFRINPHHLHNDLLEIGIEYGVIGFGLILLIIYKTLSAMIKNRQFLLLWLFLYVGINSIFSYVFWQIIPLYILIYCLTKYGMNIFTIKSKRNIIFLKTGLIIVLLFNVILIYRHIKADMYFHWSRIGRNEMKYQKALKSVSLMSYHNMYLNNYLLNAETYIFSENNGSIIESIEQYTENLLYSHPYNSIYQYNIGRIFLKLSDSKINNYLYRARKHLSNAIYLSHGLKREYFNEYGLCLKYFGEIRSAEMIFLRMIKLYPNSRRAYINLGNLYINTNKYGKAYRIFGVAKKKFIDDVYINNMFRKLEMELRK